jgi:hypothetical protein
VQEVRWDKGGTAREGDYTFLYGKGNEYYVLETGFFVTYAIGHSEYEKVKHMNML